MQHWYIAKNTGPWMLDELMVFSQKTKFNLLFLRNQPAFFQDKLREIENNGINIIHLSNNHYFSIKKVFFSLKFIINNISAFSNPHSFIYGIKAILYFIRFDERLFNRPELSIHAQFATQATIFGLLVKYYFKGSKSVSFYFTFHAYDIYVKNKWFRLLVDQANKAFSISKYNIQYVKNTYKIREEKIAYSPLGVFLPDNIKYQPSNDIINIGFLSYFVEMKGIRFLLPAIKELKELGLNFMFHFAGDGPLKQEILDYFKKNNLEDVTTYHGLIKNEVKDKFYRSLDLFVLPSFSKGMETDGLPVVLMEAASYGLPIISTNISGIPEICRDDFNGFLIKEKDSHEIVSSIIRFSQNHALWPIMSQNGIETSKLFNIEKNAEDKLKLLAWR